MVNSSLERSKNKVLWPGWRWQRRGTWKAVAHVPGGSCRGVVLKAGVSKGMRKTSPHLQWFQVPPLPWLRPGSAYIYIYIYIFIFIYIYISLSLFLDRRIDQDSLIESEFFHRETVKLTPSASRPVTEAKAALPVTSARMVAMWRR